MVQEQDAEIARLKAEMDVVYGERSESHIEVNRLEAKLVEQDAEIKRLQLEVKYRDVADDVAARELELEAKLAAVVPIEAIEATGEEVIVFDVIDARVKHGND